jgi:hypothetical protein
LGFKEVKSKVIECLDNGFVIHEARNNIDIKNLLSTGAVSIGEVATIIGRARGNDYSNSPHHFDSEIDVHIIKTNHFNKSWYIKWYFTEPDCVFISAHEQD